MQNGATAWEHSPEFLRGLNTELPCNPAIPLPGMYTWETGKWTSTPKPGGECLCHYSQQYSTQRPGCSLTEWIHTAQPIHNNGILFSHKKEPRGYNMNKPWKHYTMRKMPATKDHRLIPPIWNNWSRSVCKKHRSNRCLRLWAWGAKRTIYEEWLLAPKRPWRVGRFFNILYTICNIYYQQG